MLNTLKILLRIYCFSEEWGVDSEESISPPTVHSPLNNHYNKTSIPLSRCEINKKPFLFFEYVGKYALLLILSNTS
jgi:hypothetical protein